MSKKSSKRGTGAQGGRRPTGAPGTEPGRGGRWSAQRKMDVVLCLLGGESLDLVAREVGVTAATLASWRERFLEGGISSLKSWKGDPLLEENARIKAKGGELTLANEILYEKIDRLEAGLRPPQESRTAWRGCVLSG